MKSVVLLLSLLVTTALPAYAQLGPAGVPGAPGLVPDPVSTPAPPEAKKDIPPPVPQECVKSKNVDRCVARVEARKKAEAACKGTPKAKFKQCVRDQSKAKQK